MANGANDEESNWKIGLAAYLSLFMLLMVYLVYTVWAAEPKTAPVTPPAGGQQAANQPATPQVQKKDSAPPEKKAEATPKAAVEGQPAAPPPAPAPGAAGQAASQPVIERIEPSTIEVGSGQTAVSIHGSGFDRESIVTIQGAQRKPDFISERHLVFPLVMADFVSPGPVVVRVSGKTGISDGAVLTVLSPRGRSLVWKAFGFKTTISQDLRLILLVLITGALGACVQALQSLADFIGDNKFKSSWGTFYIVRPAIGAGVGFVFYLVLRGGLASGAGFDPAAVNPFGVTAVAALVGMFSDKAMVKLQEIFVTLFKADDTRKGKLKDLDITTAAKLKDAKAGADYRVQLEVSGGTSPYSWARETALPAWLNLDGAKGELSGTPTTAKDEVFTIRVKDAAGASVTREFKLSVKP